MSLVTPDSGLLIWMTLIFGIVFFLLAKYGFPVITKNVEKRTDYIRKSLRDAEEAETRIRHLAEEQAVLLEKAKKEQRDIIKDAAKIRAQIIEAAKEEARDQAANIIDQARVEIAAEKESALRDIRKLVALMSLKVSEKVVRADLAENDAQMQYLNKMVDEVSRKSN